MPEYVVYIHPDQIRLGSERLVANILSGHGFQRAKRQGDDSPPLATLLFVGNSSLSESELARSLESALREDLSFDLHVMAFQMSKLRSHPPVRLQTLCIVKIPAGAV